MKKLIALKGRANSGKTGTMKKVFELLKTKYPDATVSIKSKKNDTDITVIMDIGKIKIGIESQGDPYSRLRDSLKMFQDENCELIVCACRTYGMTVNWINEMKEYEKKWIKQTYCNKEDQDANNNIKAEQIVEMVGELIKKNKEEK